MEAKRKEIRTPRENLLIFVVVEEDGRQMLEIKKSYKTDYIDLNQMIQLLSDLKQQNLIPQYASYSD